MSVRYQFIKNPKLTIYETPAEAYLILEGASQSYKVAKEARKRNVGTLSCRHCTIDKQRKCYRVCESKYTDQTQNKHKLERHDSHCKHGRTFEDQKRESYREQSDNNFIDDEGLKQKDGKRRALSSLHSDLANRQRKEIICNYPKHLQKQNVQLRKENEFLQNYVKMMETRCKSSKQGTEKPPPILRTSESQKIEKNCKQSTAKFSHGDELYGNRLQSTKEQSQVWHSYIG